MAETRSKLQLSAEDLELLNSKIGLKNLFSDKKTNVEKALRMAQYEMELRELQAKLIDLQQWIIDNNKKAVILFEGRDAAGKGGAIRRITAHINPRYYRIIALPKPTEEEAGQWYFQRYVNHLPQPGEMVFFDRSWYNRAVVEPVNGFCTPKQYETFMGQVNEFERMIIESDTFLIKFYFSITKAEQERRFKDIKTSPLKKWKMTRVDERAQELWDEYTKYKLRMFEHTDTKRAPWIIIDADKKPEARTKALEYILERIPFGGGE
ncbi:MAG: polyphosphate kinase 2 [Bacteroidetes bacterium]|nr:polyphosphate kinase 2 [Bacteroidota bacterium]MCB0842413.1 polyphosphate kinase 2 [Bacteroidota bacterium]